MAIPFPETCRWEWEVWLATWPTTWWCWDMMCVSSHFSVVTLLAPCAKNNATTLGSTSRSLSNGMACATGSTCVSTTDTDIINDLTPNFLSCRINPINQSEAVVADANLSVDSLRYLIDHCRAPLFVDAVSTNKALRVVEALKESDAHRLHTLKLNRQEALVATESDTVEQAAAKLAEMGVEHILVTLGAAGVLCCDGSSTLYFPSQPVDVVNTTGAGDAFLAAVVHALLRGVPFPLAAQYGQQVARATLLTKQSVNPEICNIPLPILS